MGPARDYGGAAVWIGDVAQAVAHWERIAGIGKRRALL
jgi:hypothetical protein